MAGNLKEYMHRALNENKLDEQLTPQKILAIMKNNLKSYSREEKISSKDKEVISKFLDWVMENQI